MAAGRRTVQAGASVFEFCREQPLLTTAIGVAIGAFLGALAPSTEVEDRVVGESSDQLKENVQDIASEQYDKVKEAGERAFEASKNKPSNRTKGPSDRISDNRPSAQHGNRATLVPDELTAPGEPYEELSNADRQE
jgi:ElaB/YqjD/DUF883 family membrane-anchored ribosome-binding protein